MSLLWRDAALHQRTAVPWYTEGHPQPSGGHPVSVRHAGFAGYVEAHEPYDDDGDHHGHDQFDEDLWDRAAPEPTEEERAHHEEHGDWPESHYEAHDIAYGHALDEKRREDRPDFEDHDLGRFIHSEHGMGSEAWQKHGEFGAIDLRQPIYATQTHVHTGHMDRHDQGDPVSWHVQHGGHHGDYLAHDHPLFATHEGRVHVLDGHNRVGAALRRGDDSIKGWHVDLDEHPHLMEDEDW